MGAVWVSAGARCVLASLDYHAYASWLRSCGRVKIVLNLRTWGVVGEWKIARLAPLLAASR